MTRITRVEIIDGEGRSYVSWEDDNDVSWQFQDDGKTLKVFVNKVKPKTGEEGALEALEKFQNDWLLGKKCPETKLEIKNLNSVESIKAEIKLLQSKLEFYEELEKQPKSLFEFIHNLGYSIDCSWEIVDAVEDFLKSKGYPSTLQRPETPQERGERIHKEMEELVNKLQEKNWEIKAETDYLIGKVQHKTKIADKDGNDYKSEPITNEELLKSNWEPSAQTPEQVEEGLRSAMRTAKEEGVFDEPEYYDELVENGVSENKQKPKTLYDILYRWWMDIFCNPIYRDWDMETSIQDLIDRIEFWNMRIKNDDEVELDEQENDKNFKNSLDLIKEWGEKNKPPTLKELLWEWWDEDWGDTKDKCIDMLVNIIDKKFIPPSNDTNGYEWEKCLKMMRDKLR
jgi:hypothetical protein